MATVKLTKVLLNQMSYNADGTPSVCHTISYNNAEGAEKSPKIWPNNPLFQWMEQNGAYLQTLPTVDLVYKKVANSPYPVLEKIAEAGSTPKKTGFGSGGYKADPERELRISVAGVVQALITKYGCEVNAEMVLDMMALKEKVISTLKTKTATSQTGTHSGGGASGTTTTQNPWSTTSTTQVESPF